MTDVTVLLSSWNGEGFLPDQLASLRAQTHADWRLRWRDDGSSDRSRTLLDEFGDAEPLADNGVHLGAARSFWALLGAHVAAGASTVAAFADQDDVWLPEKLGRGVAALGTVPPDQPALYCGPQMLVDRRLRAVEPSLPLRRRPGFPDALAQNVATGCTVQLNRTAQHLLARTEPPPGTVHDWWAYLVVAAAGGRILFDRVPTVLYRQHRDNAIGAPPTVLRRAAGVMRRGPGAFMDLFRRHVAALRAIAPLLTPEAVDLLDEIRVALAAGPRERVALLRQHPIHRQTAIETGLFRLWFILG